MSRSIRFDRAAGFYDATRGFPPGVERAVAAHLATVAGLTRESRVLEIGAGTGRIALPLSRHTGLYAGVDLSPAMLAVLRSKQTDEPVVAVQADATRLPFADSLFDLAVGIHVLHLIAAWRQVVAELGRVVRPGGAVLLSREKRGRSNRIHERWDELLEAEGVTRTRQPGERSIDTIAAALAAEGFSERRDGVAAEWVQAESPNELVAKLAARVWSSTWEIPEPAFSRALAGLREWIAATFPDPDQPLRETSRFEYALFRRPCQPR